MAGDGGPVGPAAPGRIGAAQAAALLATAAAAVSLGAGLGTYLYIRFTQQRRRSPADAKPPEVRPPATGEGADRRRAP